ncbi:MAG: aldo/keto reductase [Aureispira sp.]
MVDIECLSSIGVGTYRMSSQHEIHFQALKTAVENGYNLIDTATNYCKGTSEELIGNFIEVHPSCADKLFIISKAGYLPTQELRTADFLQFLAENTPSIAEIDTDFEYSLDPSFINYQLESSLNKIKRDYVDVYLLHNPERLFQSKNLNKYSDLHAAITKAFALLEEKVAEGKIRYYGVSSNNIFDPSQNGAISCQELLDIAASIQADHHFKFIQFPFNFKERAALQANYQNQSLLELARKNGLITIGNRPLNMNENGLEFRLVTHEEALKNWKEQEAILSLDRFLQRVDSEIKELTASSSTVLDFEPMVLLQKHFANFQGRDAVERFFQQQIIPFIQTVFEENWTPIEALLEQTKKQACLYALNNQTTRTKLFLDQLKQEDIPIKENSVLTACHAYIHHFKLDHVLVGLRKPTYVHALNRTFARK